MNKLEATSIVNNPELVKEVKVLKSHMDNMYTAIRNWEIKAKLIDLNPTPPEHNLDKLIKEAISKFAKENKLKVSDVEESDSTKIKNKIEKENKAPAHYGYWIIQGQHTSPNGKIFHFQITREHNVSQENGKPQYKLTIQRGENDSITYYPSNNPDIKAVILNYIHNPEPSKLELVVEDKKSTNKK